MAWNVEIINPYHLYFKPWISNFFMAKGHAIGWSGLQASRGQMTATSVIAYFYGVHIIYNHGRGMHNTTLGGGVLIKDPYFKHVWLWRIGLI